MFCVKCGKEIGVQDSFCRYCGGIQSVEEIQHCEVNTALIGNNFASTLKYMVCTQTDYYLAAFRRIESGRKMEFSLKGLWSPFWLLYRKMYTEFVILMGMTLTLSLFGLLGILINFGIQIFLMFKLNHLYYRHICKKLHTIGLIGVDIEKDTFKQDVALRAGGASVRNVIIYAIIIVLVIVGCMVYVLNSVNTDSSYTYNEVSNKSYTVSEEEQFYTTPLDMLVHWEEINSNDFYMNVKAKTFIRAHPELFINPSIEEAKQYMDNTIEYKHLRKSCEKYSDRLIPILGKVISIDEYYDSIIEQRISEIHLLDEDMNSYYVVYLGELEDIFEDMEFGLLALPASLSGFDNISGGYTNVVVMVGSARLDEGTNEMINPVFSEALDIAKSQYPEFTEWNAGEYGEGVWGEKCIVFTAYSYKLQGHYAVFLDEEGQCYARRNEVE